MDIAIMIEGQNGLDWPRWQRLAFAVEELGFAGLYRSDHYTNANPPDKASLECWVSLTWLASHTNRIEFGPLVSPVSFRHPTLTARMAAAVDDLSAGRLTLGVGAGWQEREHTNFGLDLLDTPGRFRRFEEGLQVITRLLNSSAPVDFEGEYYHLHEALLLPRPARPGGPRLLVGGNGAQRTLPLAARYAQEWNAVYLTVEQYEPLNLRLDELLEEMGRQKSEVRRSMMVGCVFGQDELSLKRKIDERTGGKRDALQLRQHGVVAGTAPQLVEQLGRLAETGLQRVMLQWLDLDDMDGLEGLARAVIPAFPG